MHTLAFIAEQVMATYLRFPAGGREIEQIKRDLNHMQPPTNKLTYTSHRTYEVQSSSLSIFLDFFR